MSKSRFLSLLFVLFGMSQVSAALPEPVSAIAVTHKQHKSGWIKRLAPSFLFRHVNNQDSLSQEKPSKLARTALVVLVASYASIAALGNFFLPLAYVGLAGVLVANILAIIVLGRKPNKKSRRYARGVLLSTGFIIATVLLILGAINLLFHDVN
ncbi:MAG: hypothetical protein JNN28_06270 [Saprospiraceae bacterium]|nr:hypothetical protein [Saprospiraceae bacterium]